MKEIVKESLWRNKKSNTVYKIINGCMDVTENDLNKSLIIYSLDNDIDNTWFAREKSQFLEKFLPVKKMKESSGELLLNIEGCTNTIRKACEDRRFENIKETVELLFDTIIKLRTALTSEQSEEYFVYEVYCLDNEYTVEQHSANENQMFKNLYKKLTDTKVFDPSAYSGSYYLNKDDALCEAHMRIEKDIEALKQKVVKFHKFRG